MNPSNLKHQQSWLLQRILTNRWSGDSPLAYPRAEFGDQQGTLVYQRGYRLRLIECLKAEFPLLRRYLGEETFGLFAMGFLEFKPSSSYTLFDLGQSFTHYLKLTQPKQANFEPWRWRLPGQLAQVETAQSQVARAQGLESNEPSLLPLPLWQLPPVWVPPTTRVFECDLDMMALMAQLSRQQVATPRPGRQQLMLYRHRYRVHRRPISALQATVLAALKSGQPWSRALELAQCNSAMTESERVAEALSWLPQWLTEGVVGLDKPADRA
ncbi:DNA-binding domain-containing protein [Ferrimonas sp. SCSIO 43195]|uniref:HvfC/BufC N-terminal domain-containing protein n=1 Tax=Ferrimonas sp. SCSIO 43195 TaxID=2822844 RepID=UPI002075AA3D|nr:DNA-binding domain-containing protein [Ferrimonas sp. SCSIO 43195]USD39275.1 putative DNA-binding domain-containing protein [Ferrimonas sp. SCSIO 43195]